MRKLLVVSFSDLSRDPRVNRQLRFLKDQFTLISAGYGRHHIDGVEHIEIPRRHFTFVRKMRAAFLLGARMFEQYYWSQPAVLASMVKLSAIECDGVLANDIDTLPLALRIAAGRPVILDAHEYAPLQNEDQWHGRLLFQSYYRYLCLEYIPKVARLMTVSDGIAEQYLSDTGVLGQVIVSAPDYVDLRPSETKANQIALVHHGGASRSRRLEYLIELVDLLHERFVLNLILVPGSQRYIHELRTFAKDNDRIKFLDPVPMRDIPHVINRFDIGVHLLPPTSFNKRFALPNKFFEFVQARLAVAIGPSPEMAKLVEKYGIGVVSESFSARSMADCLNAMSNEELTQYKQAANRAAHDCSADAVQEHLRALVHGVFE